jgi:hypothetical protein
VIVTFACAASPTCLRSRCCWADSEASCRSGARRSRLGLEAVIAGSLSNLIGAVRRDSFRVPVWRTRSPHDGNRHLVSFIGIGAAPTRTTLAIPAQYARAHRRHRARAGISSAKPHSLGLCAAKEAAENIRPVVRRTSGRRRVPSRNQHGQDTPAVMEMAGCQCCSMGYSRRRECLSAAAPRATIELGRLPGVLGNCHASAPRSLRGWARARAHRQTGRLHLGRRRFQIACHERHSDCSGCGTCA